MGLVTDRLTLVESLPQAAHFLLNWVLSLQLLEEDKGVGLQRTTMSAKPTAQNDACISSLILSAKCVRTAQGHLQGTAGEVGDFPDKC